MHIVFPLSPPDCALIVCIITNCHSCRVSTNSSPKRCYFFESVWYLFSIFPLCRTMLFILLLWLFALPPLLPCYILFALHIIIFLLPSTVLNIMSKVLTFRAKHLLSFIVQTLFNDLSIVILKHNPRWILLVQWYLN